jgi:Cd2+/Zn2+-exporting ATPase
MALRVRFRRGDGEGFGTLEGEEILVHAGTINGAGAPEVQVIRRTADTSLARLVRMVNEAEARKSPTQRFTERFERIVVPVVLASVFVLLFAFLVIDENFGESFYRAMAVLVAASPRALAISTPSAVLFGIARAARGGVLVKAAGPSRTSASWAPSPSTRPARSPRASRG